MTQLRDEPASSGSPAIAPALGAKAGDFEVLDLFCGAGGAAMGIHRALVSANIPHKITGVDIVNQPRYPFCFRLANAMHYPLENFDFIWASPPCQAYSRLQQFENRNHPALLPATRWRLSTSGAPWIVENVYGAPMRFPVMLCGLDFGLGVYRHRFFEASFGWLVPSHKKHNPEAMQRGEIFQVCGHSGGTRMRGKRRLRFGKRDDWCRAMGIEWMTNAELSQAVPPAYSEFIFRQFLAQRRECTA